MAAICAEFPVHHPSMLFDRAIRRSGTSGKNSTREFIRFRPDLWWDLGTHVLIVEVDEHQHVCYDKEEDEERTVQLQKGTEKPVVLLRFNPDTYKDINGMHQSCNYDLMEAGGGGAVWRARLQVLLSRLHLLKDLVPKKRFTIEHLFFDNYHR